MPGSRKNLTTMMTLAESQSDATCSAHFLTSAGSGRYRPGVLSVHRSVFDKAATGRCSVGRPRSNGLHIGVHQQSERNSRFCWRDRAAGDASRIPDIGSFGILQNPGYQVGDVEPNADHPMAWSIGTALDCGYRSRSGICVEYQYGSLSRTRSARRARANGSALQCRGGRSVCWRISACRLHSSRLFA